MVIFTGIEVKDIVNDKWEVTEALAVQSVEEVTKRKQRRSVVLNSN